MAPGKRRGNGSMQDPLKNSISLPDINKSWLASRGGTTHSRLAALQHQFENMAGSERERQKLAEPRSEKLAKSRRAVDAELERELALDRQKRRQRQKEREVERRWGEVERSQQAAGAGSPGLEEGDASAVPSMAVAPAAGSPSVAGALSPSKRDALMLGAAAAGFAQPPQSAALLTEVRLVEALAKSRSAGLALEDGTADSPTRHASEACLEALEAVSELLPTTYGPLFHRISHELGPLLFSPEHKDPAGQRMSYEQVISHVLEPQARETKERLELLTWQHKGAADGLTRELDKAKFLTRQVERLEPANAALEAENGRLEAKLADATAEIARLNEWNAEISSSGSYGVVDGGHFPRVIRRPGPAWYPV